MPIPVLTTVRAGGSLAAIIFIHGFGGDPAKTWAGFPSLIRDDNRLAGWDIYTVGYTTRLVPDLVGIWSADAPLDILSVLLKTILSEGTLAVYDSLVLIAHSMGGLLTQRMLIDHAPIASRVTHVFLFGTPSAGLEKAGRFAFLKRQTRDMGAESKFIKDLRTGWDTKLANTAAFKFRTIAGDQDEFVPASSSLEPFRLDQQSVVAGNHLTIVKPGSTADLGLQIVIGGIMGDAAPAGPRNSARVAAESREFLKTIQMLEPNKHELDPQAAIALALAYEECGRQSDAITLLELVAAKANTKTDSIGVLAGRLKRRWLVDRRRSDADRALQLYQQGYDVAVPADDWDQAVYHGINVAFMHLAYSEDIMAARKIAAEVREHCQHLKPGFWRLAAEADANLILGEKDAAVELYRQAVALGAAPRQIKSMCQQALRLADLLQETEAEEQIDALCRGEDLSSV